MSDSDAVDPCADDSDAANDPCEDPDDVEGVGAEGTGEEGTGKRRKKPKNGRRRLSEILRELADEPGRERVSVGDILTTMSGRASAALLFLFAAPNVIPAPPGTSALLGLPMIYLASQMMLRRQPWLPGVIAARSMRIDDFAALVNRAVPMLARAERMLRPRFLVLVNPTAERIIGGFCLILALVVALPIPLGNMLPAFAVSVLALGFLERDGLWVIIGAVLGLLSLVVVSGVVWAAVKSLIFLLGHAFG